MEFNNLAEPISAALAQGAPASTYVFMIADRDSKEVMRLTPDHRIEFAPSVTPDIAAAHLARLANAYIAETMPTEANSQAAQELGAVRYNLTRLQNTLHKAQSHPDYEYRAVVTPHAHPLRDDFPSEGDEWWLNLYVCPRGVERHEHEDITYWYREVL
jgi:hypothetical protein